MEQPTTMRVAENLRAILARRRVSGREFSERMGWTSSAGHRRLTGEYALTVDELARAAAVLEIPLADLLDGVERPAAPEAASA